MRLPCCCSPSLAAAPCLPPSLLRSVSFIRIVDGGHFTRRRPRLQIQLPALVRSGSVLSKAPRHGPGMSLPLAVIIPAGAPPGTPSAAPELWLQRLPLQLSSLAALLSSLGVCVARCAAHALHETSNGRGGQLAQLAVHAGGACHPCKLLLVFLEAAAHRQADALAILSSEAIEARVAPAGVLTRRAAGAGGGERGSGAASVCSILSAVRCCVAGVATTKQEHRAWRQRLTSWGQRRVRSLPPR